MKKGIIELFSKVWDVEEIKSSTLGKGIEIDLTDMYEVPVEFNFKNLIALSEFFGTKDIDWNNISQSGCDTCDYGSRYGFEVQIYNITSGLDKIEWE